MSSMVHPLTNNKDSERLSVLTRGLEHHPNNHKYPVYVSKFWGRCDNGKIVETSQSIIIKHGRCKVRTVLYERPRSYTAFRKSEPVASSTNVYLSKCSCISLK